MILRMMVRGAAWIFVMIVAIACGLPLDHVTLFWVGILSAWLLTR